MQISFDSQRYQFKKKDIIQDFQVEDESYDGDSMISINKKPFKKKHKDISIDSISFRECKPRKRLDSSFIQTRKSDNVSSQLHSRYCVKTTSTVDTYYTGNKQTKKRRKSSFTLSDLFKLVCNCF